LSEAEHHAENLNSCNLISEHYIHFTCKCTEERTLQSIMVRCVGICLDWWGKLSDDSSVHGRHVQYHVTRCGGKKEKKKSSVAKM